MIADAHAGSAVMEWAVSLPGFLRFFVSDAFSRFAKAFAPAFLTTGVLLGMIYVLAMRAIKADRKAVEAWFEQVRQRLDAGPVPVIEWVLPAMLGALHAIYGKSAPRRLLTSLSIGLLFTVLVFFFVYGEYKQAPDAVRQEKLALERGIDTKLYSYATDPQLRVIWDQLDARYPVQVGDQTMWEFVYEGGIYDELRQRKDDFEVGLARKLAENPNRTQLTPIFLVEGTYVRTGFQWLHALFLYLFNALLDFTSVTVAILALGLLRRSSSFARALAAFFSASVTTLLCAAAAFLSYRLFFRGDTGFFVQLLVELPLGLLTGGLAVLCGAMIVNALLKRDETTDGIGSVLFMGAITGAILTGIAVALFRDLWAYWRPMSIGWVSWKDFFSLPYALAATTLIPTVLILAAFALMIATKMTAEPARVLPAVYMTFIKEEVGGTQASGIILLLSALAGTVVGVIWQ